MYSPLISVIVPTYNRQDTLETCIRSVLNSDYENIEVIIVDDGSTDCTAQVCRKIIEVDHRVNILRQCNAGISAARNAGLRVAKGEWISFIDDDDAVLPSYYKNMIAAADETTDLIMVGRGMGFVDGGIVRSVSDNKDSFQKDIKGNAEIISFIFGEYNPYKNTFFHCTDKLFRRDLIVGKEICFRENVSLGEDQIFVLDYLKYTERFFYDSKHYYLVLVWDIKKKNYSIGHKLCTPEYFFMIQRENYDAFERLLSVCPDRNLKLYEVNYILDRPITRILFNYTLFRNIRKYSYSRLCHFTRCEIIPFLNKEISMIMGVKNQKVVYFLKALRKQPFVLVYLQLLIMTNSYNLWTKVKSRIEVYNKHD